jgi:hypothetical protein
MEIFIHILSDSGVLTDCILVFSVGLAEADVPRSLEAVSPRH